MTAVLGSCGAVRVVSNPSMRWFAVDCRLYPAIGSLLTDYDYARREYNKLTDEAATIPLRDMVYNKVTAHDRANTVILGDPTAALPLPLR
jgi:hypothetical protein